MRNPTVAKLISLYQSFTVQELEAPANVCWRLSEKDASDLFQYVSTTQACQGTWGEVTSTGDLKYLFGLRIVSVDGKRTTLKKGIMTNEERIKWRLTREL